MKTMKKVLRSVVLGVVLALVLAVFATPVVGSSSVDEKTGTWERVFHVQLNAFAPLSGTPNAGVSCWEYLGYPSSGRWVPAEYPYRSCFHVYREGYAWYLDEWRGPVGTTSPVEVENAQAGTTVGVSSLVGPVNANLQWAIRWNMTTQTWQLHDGAMFVWGIPSSEGDPVEVVGSGYEDGALWVRVRVLYPTGQRNPAPDRTYLVWPYGKPNRYGFRS